MTAKTKTIKMLLYDGTLNGVMNISDSAWESGKMYSAPRESINALVCRADCKKYGVYLLLSEQQVYVGQASDLERRTRQHLTDKDWWTQVILMTTKDDSFNASDIDYLESRLIDLAGKAGKSDSENRKRGNPQKVDEFRQAELEQYLEEALFLLELVGIRVFINGTKKQGVIKRVIPVETFTASETAPTVENAQNIPSLPNESMRIGEYVYTAMRGLEAVTFKFSEADLNEMCTSEWSQKIFHTNKPFMKLYAPGKTDNKGVDGYVRFRSEPFTFGNQQVLISKEWYERQRPFFIAWYNSLNKLYSDVENDLPKSSNDSLSIRLPDSKLKIGSFVRQAMENLSQSGFEFSDEDIQELCSESSMKTVIGMQRKLPFFKLYNPNDIDGHLIDGKPRFYSKPLTYGKYSVYLNSQIYETDREPFIKWFEHLKKD